MTTLLLALILILSGVVLYLLLSKKAGSRKLGFYDQANKGWEESLKDPITQLYNKRHLMQRLQETMARCDRDKNNLAVVLWDIDGFVGFNNEYGLKEGDRLLQQVAGSIKKSVRVYDEIFRSGPDEFCAILSPADSDIAREVTKRVSDLVAKELFEGNAQYAEHHFSLSSGYVFYPGETQTPDALLHAANQALYKSRLAPAAAE